MAKNKCPEKKRGAPAWMTTYGDMVTLLLTFFVALIAMSTISPGKFQQVAAGLQLIFSGKPPSVLLGGKSLSKEPLITSKKGIKEELMRIMEEEKYKGKITIEETDKGTVIILKNMALFEPASARLTAEAKRLLAKVGTLVIEHTTNVLEIYGYCDDTPLPKNSIYPSKWHLGAARAASVARFFAVELKEKRIRDRLVDIQLGRFLPDYFYNPDRFIPVGVGDKSIMKEITKLKMELSNELKKLNDMFIDGSISKKEWEERTEKLNENFEEKLKKLRKEYRRIDILIKRESVR